MIYILQETLLRFSNKEEQNDGKFSRNGRKDDIKTVVKFSKIKKPFELLQR
jgi:hypothetical protein